eukprot:14549-Eustigmatos_ZCMA.PRE.1
MPSSANLRKVVALSVCCVDARLPLLHPSYRGPLPPLSASRHIGGTMSPDGQLLGSDESTDLGNVWILPSAAMATCGGTIF